MGICRLNKENALYRRIDIKTYPRRYAAFALLYFTGSDHFNRSMRSYADKTGFKLTDKGLFRCTLSRDAKGKRIKLPSENIVCYTEAEIFSALGLPYKEPTDRNCFDVSYEKSGSGADESDIEETSVASL